ncbi:hypothetical protein [Rhizobium sp. LjRoot254]|uniref:hypothetical protein n=1 Tax=Rhizobium sp. LjRoot254 TaxID=3342297 RepID=UPI003ECF2600
MPIPKEHLEVFNRHLRSSIVEATVEGGAYAFRVSVPDLESSTQQEVAVALEAAVKELRDSGQTVPRIKWGPTTVLRAKRAPHHD